jgi:molybdate transport system regulatory protein
VTSAPTLRFVRSPSGKSPAAHRLEKEDHMAVSARNQLKGKVQTMVKGDVMAEVSIDVGSGNTIVAVITRQSAETLNIKAGDDVTAVIKATEVMVAKE